MSRRSGGGGGGRSVQVSGYTRSNGTYVAGYTRSAPSSSGASSGRSSAGPSSVVSVSGYSRADGTKVSGYTRSTPTRSNSGASSGHSFAGPSSVSVSGYTRADGTKVSGYTRSTPTRSNSGANPSGERCYVDNAYNREHGRVGKPLGTHPLSSSGERSYVDNAFNRKHNRVGKPLGTHPLLPSGERCYVDNPHNRRLGRVGQPIRHKQKQIMEEYTMEDLVMKLRDLFHQSAYDMLQQEEVHMSWEKEHIDIFPESSSLACLIPDFISYDELEGMKKIGRGGFGEVYACLWHGKPVAFKQLLHQNMSRKCQEQFEREIKILVALDHPNIVKMFGAVVEEEKMGIVMEYMKRSLFRALFIDCTEFPDAKKKEIVSQLASAVQYLHTHEPMIAHCDIKSGNVLLGQHDNAKLCDFGLSSIKKASETSRSSATAPPAQGTPRYSAPEVLRGELLTINQLFMADIYSLAIVVFEVIVEEEPYEDLSVLQLQAQVGRGNLRPTSEVKLSRPLSELLDVSWDSSAPKRPTAAEFKEKWDKLSDLYD